MEEKRAGQAPPQLQSKTKWLILINLHKYNNSILQRTKLVYKNILFKKKQAFHKFSSFHLASEVLVLDLEHNYVSPTQDTHNQPNTRSVLLLLSNLLHHVTTSLSPNTSTLLLRFTLSSFLRQHSSLVLRLLRPAFCTHVPRQMALCRELRDGLLMASQWWKMCSRSRSSHLLMSLTTTFFFFFFFFFFFYTRKINLTACINPKSRIYANARCRNKKGKENTG